MHLIIGTETVHFVLSDELSKLGLEHWYATMSGRVEEGAHHHFIGRRIKIPFWKFWVRCLWIEKFDIVASLHNEPHRNFFNPNKPIRVEVHDKSRLDLAQVFARGLEQRLHAVEVVC